MTGLLAAPAQAAETAASPADTSSAAPNKACNGKVTLGMARNKGDLYHSSAVTVLVPHNHIGIYYTKNIVVEAPGPGSYSQSRTASTHRVCGPVYKMSVNAKQSSRDSAANYSYQKLRGRPYDKGFLNNKVNGDSKLNCSELVWKAYKRAANIELDYNGGLAVYPDDIKNDSSTVIYQTIR